MLENNFQPSTRTVYTWNDNATEPFEVFNISLACNHCENPVCLSGCPAKAYVKDESGVVIHYPERCMGCGYCTWRCPYDAPKINESKGYIEKCHFCYQRKEEGIDPACVTACPTGAISIVYEDEFPERASGWFPETGIGPSVKIKGVNQRKPVIIPGEQTEAEPVLTAGTDKIRKEWSLIVFSSLVMLASSVIISSYFSDVILFKGTVAVLLAFSVFISFVHLGVSSKAWRAPLHFISSPLSREIILVSLLAVLSVLDYFRLLQLPPLLMPVLALITLISVDLVYFSVDRSLSLKLHSGQTFFSSLLAVSLLTASINSFIVFTFLAAVSIVYRYKTLPATKSIRNIYYYRALTLPFTLMLLYFRPDTPVAFIASILLMLTGVVADRVLFYFDFKPENVREKITEHFISEYEKERDKQRQDAGIS